MALKSTILGLFLALNGANCQGETWIPTNGTSSSKQFFYIRIITPYSSVLSSTAELSSSSSFATGGFTPGDSSTGIETDVTSVLSTPGVYSSSAGASTPGGSSIDTETGFTSVLSTPTVSSVDTETDFTSVTSTPGASSTLTELTDSSDSSSATDYTSSASTPVESSTDTETGVTSVVSTPGLSSIVSEVTDSSEPSSTADLSSTLETTPDGTPTVASTGETTSTGATTSEEETTTASSGEASTTDESTTTTGDDSEHSTTEESAGGASTTQGPTSTDSVVSETVITSGSETGDFTRTRDTDYSSITGAITTSTDVETTSGSKTTSTDVPIIIGIGGWWWLPLAGPGLKFPSFPAPTPPTPTEEDPDDDKDKTTKSSDSPSSTEDPTSTETEATSTTSTVACTATSGSSGLRRREDGSGEESCELATEYVVIPSARDSVTTSAVYAKILTYVDASSVDTTSLSDYGVVFWTVQMTESDAKQLKEYSKVSEVWAPCTSDCDNPYQGLRQQESSDDLVMLSQAQGVELSEYNNQYIFEDKPGNGVDVYISDTGANLKHKEFTQGYNIAKKARWIHPEPKYASEGDMLDGHGTCMLSRLAGHKYGVAKDVNPVIVRNPLLGGMRLTILGFRKIIEDVGSGKQGVLSMSWTSSRKDDKGELNYKDPSGNDAYDGVRAVVASLLKELVNKGMTLVCASGNDRASTVEGFPAELAKSDIGDDYIPELIVVGATNLDGTQRWEGTNYEEKYGLPHVYAPGWNVQCADYSSNDAYKEDDGTSQATAAVAGMAAYLIKFAKDNSIDVSTSQKVRDLVLGWAWERTSGVPAIYNGVRFEDVKKKQGVPACKVFKRDSDIDFPDLTDCTLEATPSATESSTATGTESGSETTASTATDAVSTTAGVDSSALTTLLTSTRQDNSSTIQDTTTVDESTSVADTTTVDEPVSTSTQEPTTSTQEEVTSTEQVPTSTTEAAPTTTTQPTSTSATAEPTTDYTFFNAECNSESDYPDHPAVHESSVEKLAGKFCDELRGDGILGNWAKAGFSQSATKSNKDTDFDFSAVWVDGCETAYTAQSLYKPLIGDDTECPDLFHDKIWKACINGGVGGSVQAGCLKYTMNAGVN